MAEPLGSQQPTAWHPHLGHWQASLERVVDAIAGTAELRDAYTAGHQRRTSTLAAAIARQLGYSDQQVRAIYLAGILHDVGKVSIPSEILTKAGRLSDAEFQLMRTHTHAGYQIAKAVDLPWPIAEIVWQHHERLDGSGYPEGITGDAILIESRVLAIADVADAMTSHRVYRPALGVEAAAAELERDCGRLYDPAAASACVALLRAERASIEADQLPAARR